MNPIFEKDILVGEDGFAYLWLYDENGILGACQSVAAHSLREIADELDKRNKPHQDAIDKYFKEHQQ